VCLVEGSWPSIQEDTGLRHEACDSVLNGEQTKRLSRKSQEQGSLEPGGLNAERVRLPLRGNPYPGLFRGLARA